MSLLKASTAYTRMFLMIQSADHITALTGASPTVNISKAGAAFGAAAGTVTEVANGWYKVALTTVDTGTTGDLAYHITATSGDATDFTDEVIAIDLMDAVHGGLSALPNTAVTTNASLITSGSGTDQLTVSGGIASADAKKINAVATTSVTTVSANQGTTQPINFTGTAGSALVKVDVTDIATAAVAAGSAQIGVNVVNWNGTVVATPATAGIPDVNAKNINNVATTSVTTINANQGTTQPINFTGTAGSALVKSDMVDVAGAAVSTSSAQIGVNAVNIAGAAAALDANNLLKVDVEDVVGASTLAELAQGIPPTTPTLAQALMALYMPLTKQVTTTASSKTIANNAGTVIFKKALTDDGTTYTEAKAVSGP